MEILNKEIRATKNFHLRKFLVTRRYTNFPEMEITFYIWYVTRTQDSKIEKSKNSKFENQKFKNSKFKNSKIKNSKKKICTFQPNGTPYKLTYLLLYVGLSTEKIMDRHLLREKKFNNNFDIGPHIVLI